MQEATEVAIIGGGVVGLAVRMQHVNPTKLRDDLFCLSMSF